MSKEYLYKLGYHIAELRLKKGLSQDVLAYEIEKSTGAISNIERGKSNARILTLKDIADRLEIDLYKLFADSEYVPVMYSPVIEQIVEMLNHEDKETQEFVRDQIEKILKFSKKKSKKNN